MPTTTTEPFSLTPDREAALWEAVEFLNIDPRASILTIARGVLTLSLDQTRETAYGAACELLLCIRQGRPVQLLQRPKPERPELPLFGADDPLRAGYTGPIAEVFPDAC